MLLGRVSEAGKKILFQNAIALLSVSKNEAFSMTTAEAMAEGCPMIGWSESKAVCELMEKYGGQTFYSEEGFKELLSDFSRDLDLRKKALPNMDRIRSEISWKKAAEKVIQWCRKTSNV